MNTQTRLIALLGLLLAIFAGSVLLLRQSQRLEEESYLREITTERAELTDRLLDLTGQTLKSLAADYSNWGEMLSFVSSGDEKWAQVNIDASLPNFGANAAWVICPQGKLIYGAVHQIDEKLKTPPFDTKKIAAYLQKNPFAHFYLLHAAGLLELRTGPIQPSEDLERKTPAQGWFIVARVWGPAHQKILATVLESEIHVEVPTQVDPAPAPHTVSIRRKLLDWNNRHVATLRADHVVPITEDIDTNNDYEMYVFLSFGLVVIAAATMGVSRWVMRPLRQLEHSLRESSPTPIHALAQQPDILGRLAQLTTSSFIQRQQLEQEIEERRRIEEALRQSREELRQSSDLKARLARDLHDGVIQSIYAAGLGLEGIRATLRPDPTTAERKLDAARQALNQTIREVRAFIQGLEPETDSRPEFTQVLRSLVATLQTLHPVHFDLQLDVGPSTFTAREEVHALQIIRECVSNAIRHGNARLISISLLREAGCPILHIRDDGAGFDPHTITRGSGLTNLAARAAEISATLEIQSSLGKGTDISLRFTQRTAAS